MAFRSSVVEWAEVQRLERAYNEHKAAERYHSEEAKKAHYARCAALVRYRQAKEGRDGSGRDMQDREACLMRNLQAYPLTKSEIIQFLLEQRTAADPQATGLVGDMSPVILDQISKIVDAAFALCDAFSRRTQPGMGFVIPFPEATALLEACKMPEGD
jgi:hypothetical protein